MKIKELLSTLASALTAVACGATASSDLKIVHGSKVTGAKGVGLHTVAIAEENAAPHCTGTLIDRYWVLTASHCLEDSLSVQVIFGLGTQWIWKVSKVDAQPYMHPYYAATSFFSTGPATHAQMNDIALLRLSEPAPSFMRPAAIAQPDEVRPGLDVIIAGYGQKSQYDILPALSLRQATTTISAVDDAGKVIFYRSRDGKSSACSGDSGGPMFVSQRDGSLRLIGSTLGPNLLDDDSLSCSNGVGVYANATRYQAWLYCRMHPAVAKVTRSVIDDPSCRPGQGTCIEDLPCRVL